MGLCPPACLPQPCALLPLVLAGIRGGVRPVQLEGLQRAIRCEWCRWGCSADQLSSQLPAACSVMLAVRPAGGPSAQPPRCQTAGKLPPAARLAGFATDCRPARPVLPITPYSDHRGCRPPTLCFHPPCAGAVGRQGNGTRHGGLERRIRGRGPCLHPRAESSGGARRLCRPFGLGQVGVCSAQSGGWVPLRGGWRRVQVVGGET